MSTPNNPRNYLVVDGGTPCGWTQAAGAQSSCNGTIVNTANGVGLSYQRDTNAIEAENCTGCEIKNIGIYGLYVQNGGSTLANPQGENCIVYSGSNFLIHNNRMRDVGWCIFYKMRAGDNGNKIFQNDIYNTPHPIFYASASAVSGTATNTFIYENHLHDYSNWDTASCVYHVEGIHASGPSSAPFPVFNYLEIYNNYFGPNEGACLFSQVYLSPNTNTSGSAALVNQSTIFNNVFAMTQTGVTAITIGGGNGNSVYNNTIIGSGASGGMGLNWSNISQNSAYTFTFKNNAMEKFYTMVNDDTSGAEGSGIIADYNVYANCTNPLGGCLNAFIPGGTSTWTTYQSNTFGQERNSKPADLGTSSKCCTGTLSLSSTFTPQTGSVLINAGENLTGLCSGNLVALCFDAAGNPRPTTGSWVAGAYAGSSWAQAPSPASGLVAIVN